MVLGQVVVWIRTDTKDKLVALKKDGESFDELVKRLIAFYEKNSDKK